MKKTVSIGALLSILLLFSCNQPKSESEFEIEGTIAEYPEGAVFLDLVGPTGFQTVDSTKTDSEGKFSLRHPADSNQIFTLRLSNNQSMMLVPMNDHLTVTANSGQLANGKVLGSARTASLQAFSNVRNRLRSEYSREYRKLQNMNQANDRERWVIQESTSDLALHGYREFVRAYADTVPHAGSAWYAASTLNPQGDFYYLQQFLERRKSAGEKSPFLNHIDHEIEKMGVDFIRYEATDFIAADISGDSVSLSDSRGKVTYLYIWASFCGLGQMEAKRLGEWRHAHPEVPIEILTFSIDDIKEPWLKAVKENGLDWKGQMLGNASWSSPEIAQFKVQSIPVSFLLDAKGIIRSKNVTATDLEKDYAEIVKKWGAQ
ncbi:MAG: AhpC/TSA family protein [Bacteroidetes bacterium]|nr:AhpC/TSA family protein [Bacteroidota bacterium]